MVSGASAPKTTTIASKGIMASTVSVLPRFCGSVTSVIHALKAASFAVEPKKVMTQSIITTNTPASITAFAAGNSTLVLCTVIRENAKVVKPQMI